MRHSTLVTVTSTPRGAPRCEKRFTICAGGSLRGPRVVGHPFPRLRSSMMAGARAPARTKNCPALARRSVNQRVPESTRTPGPMVEDSVTRLRYTPFEEAGFDFCRSAISACRFSFSAFTSKLALPIVQ